MGFCARAGVGLGGRSSVNQLSISEFNEIFKADPREGLNLIAKDHPNDFIEVTKRFLNVGESEAQKLRRIQQNGNSAISWEEKELLEKIIKASAMHAGVKELAESFKKHKEELDKEVEEELSANRVGLASSGHGKSAYGLPNNLSSLSHNEQVHHLTDHFMHGGSVDDLEKVGI